MVRMLSRVARNGALTGPGGVRNISKYLEKDISAKAVREKFVDFFKNKHSHEFVRSSPVVPFCDPTVAFVNAGMNQFKGIFLGTESPQFTKVTNSQKCVRVGGKHNDLNIVGTDGFHHTFFEMLGNWSFGDYFKKEACEMAWELLTKVYKIHPSRLYVTYFSGDKTLNLDADLECRDIWQQIGVPDSRILPFGPSDNFWEMGPTGPCGPCTEIHIDHLGPADRPQFVNKGLYDLTELWNIVFIQFNREIDGKISPLPKRHVDTGMGFERLVAVLQKHTSNYSTDVFEPIFRGIQKNCKNVPAYQGKFGENDWNNLDTAYRILADHSRMITACLADGMIPEQNQKLRRVIRKFLSTSETNFKKDKGLLKETSNYVIESLGVAFPEMERNCKQVHAIIEYEESIFADVRKNAVSNMEKLIKTNKDLANLPCIDAPGLVPALKEITSLQSKEISTELAFKLYDTYGLDTETIQDVCDCLKLSYDEKKLHDALERAKVKSKSQFVKGVANNTMEIEKVLGKTNDSYKYAYRRENKQYTFDRITSTLIGVMLNGECVDTVPPSAPCSLILDRTNFYSEAGGQKCDVGNVDFDNALFTVTNVTNINGALLHEGRLQTNTPISIKTGFNCTPVVEKATRLNTMRNHTSVHILNAIVKDIKGVTCQKGSRVAPEGLWLELGVFSDKLGVGDVEKIEAKFRKVIESNSDVNIDVLDSQQLLGVENLTIIPGEVYPSTGIRLVTIKSDNILSREPCCGTHVLNTRDIETFSIINCKSLGRSTTSIFAVTGQRALLAQNNGKLLMEDIDMLKKHIADNIDAPEALELAVQAVKQRLNFDITSDAIIPYSVKSKCSEQLNEVAKKIKDTAKSQLKEFIDLEMKNVIDTKTRLSKTNRKYLVHYLQTSMILENVSLTKATKLCADLPVLVIAFSDSSVKARCCVPKSFVSDDFNAQKWLESVTEIFHSAAVAPKGQDPRNMCNMKAKKVNIQDFDALLSESLEAAKKYAQNCL